MSGIYASDGSYNVSVVDGSVRTGLYAADGSWNVFKTDGSVYTGLYHPCGAYNVFLGSNPGWYAPNGAMNISDTGATGYNRVTVVSGTLHPGGGGTAASDIYPFLLV